MKTLTFCLMLLLSFSVNANTCSGPQLMIESSLHGKWERGDFEWTFKPNGTFFGTGKRNNIVVWEFSGSWELNDNKLNWLYQASSMERFVGIEDTDIILNIACDKYTFISSNGETKDARKTP